MPTKKLKKKSKTKHVSFIALLLTFFTFLAVLIGTIALTRLGTFDNRQQAAYVICEPRACPNGCIPGSTTCLPWCDPAKCANGCTELTSSGGRALKCAIVAQTIQFPHTVKSTPIIPLAASRIHTLIPS